MKARKTVVFITFLFILVTAAAILLSGCGNKQLIDTTYTFDYGIIKLPDGEIVEGPVQSWKDYEGDQIQVCIDDVTYLVHASNAVLEYSGKR